MLQGIIYAFRIVDKNGKVILPLDDWPYSEVKVSEGMEGNGTFNSEENSIMPGDYTLQLVKIDKNAKQAFIIATKDFSITPKYTKEKLSGLQAWIVRGDDPNSEHFEDLHFDGPGSYSAWVQTKGYSVSGKVIASRIDPSGVEDPSSKKEDILKILKTK